MTLPYFSGSVSANSSSAPPRRKDRGQLKQEIQELLKSISQSQSGTQICPHCGKRMQHINATFSLYGTAGNWEVQLPVCDCSGSLPNAEKPEVRGARAA